MTMQPAESGYRRPNKFRPVLDVKKLREADPDPYDSQNQAATRLSPAPALQMANNTLQDGCPVKSKEEGKGYSVDLEKTVSEKLADAEESLKKLKQAVQHPASLLEPPFWPCNCTALTEFDMYQYHVVLGIFRLMEIQSSTCIDIFRPLLP